MKFKFTREHSGFSVRKWQSLTLLAALLIIGLIIGLNACGYLALFLAGGPHDPRPSPIPPTSVPELIKALEDPRARLGAIGALGRLGAEAEAAVPALTEILTNPASTSEMRIGVAYALRDIGPPAASAAPELVKMMQGVGYVGGRSAAAAALGGLGDTSVVPALVAELYNADVEDRELMIDAARSLAYLTGNPFIDSEPGRHGYRLAGDGTPLIAIEALNWWESKGQYQQWADIDPE